MKRTLLSLRSQLIVVFVSVVLIASIIGIIVTEIVESDHIASSTDVLYSTLESNELNALWNRMSQMQATTSDSFAQFIKNCEFQHDYAKNVFSGEYNIDKFYPNYNTMDANPSGTVKGMNAYVSFYYQHSGAISSHLDNSSILDNSHGSMYKSTNLYSGVYMGFEDDGLYRYYPYLDVSSTYPTISGYCYHFDRDYVGYDPRCRLWYYKAVTNEGDVIFTEPYFDASTNLALITAAKAVVLNGRIFGVVAADLSISPLANFILSATVLETGYTYLCTSQSVLVVHPDIDYNSIYHVGDVEFPNSASERVAFENILQNHVFTGEFGQQMFMKNNERWYVTYSSVVNTNYFLLMVVPESEVLEPAVTIQDYGNVALNQVILTVICVSIACILIGAYCAHILADKIVEPVNVFNKILADIAEEKFHENPDVKEVNDFHEINHLQGKIHNLFLAVKFSTSAYHSNDFETALAYLMEVEEMFVKINQQRALGVIYNNRGNILRRQCESLGGEPDYSEALASFVLAVGNMRTYVKSATEAAEAGYAKHQKGETTENLQDLYATASLFKKGLASRLVNYGDCLREAGHTEKSLEAFNEAYEIYLSEDDLSGMVKCLGNKGLLLVDMNDYEGAEKIFTQCITSAYRVYADSPSDSNVVDVQQSHLNLALHYYKVAQSAEKNKNTEVLTKYLDLALHNLYTCLTVSNRIQRVVQSSCLVTLEEIYTKYYGEVGDVAVLKLYEMYPVLTTLGNKKNIDFVIDVSPSMYGSRIDVCQSTLLEIISSDIRNGDLVSITAFEKAIVPLVEPTVMTPASRQHFINKVGELADQVPVRGATFFYKTLLKVGRDIMNSSCTVGRWVVALTDGADNERLTRPCDVKSFYRTNDIKLIIVAVDIQDQEVVRTLKELVSEPKFFIDASSDPQAIKLALQRGFKLVTSGNVNMEAL